MSRLEGNGASRLVQLMRKHGYNKDVDVMLGKITSAPPAIKVQPLGYTFELEAEDVVVAFGVSDILATGDTVILISANNSQQWYVIDKAVTY